MELSDLARLLEGELSYERQPVKRDCESCVKLNHELTMTRKKVQSNIDRIHDLEKQIAVIRELKEENQSLRKQLVRDADNPSYQSVLGELTIEKQRRVRAEQELEMYRKQGKTADEKVANNAKRVAIALAKHCLELSHELQKLRDGTKRADEQRRPGDPGGTRASATSSELASTTQKVAGWGMDDDIFDEIN